MPRRDVPQRKDPLWTFLIFSMWRKDCPVRIATISTRRERMFSMKANWWKETKRFAVPPAMAQHLDSILNRPITGNAWAAIESLSKSQRRLPLATVGGVMSGNDRPSLDIHFKGPGFKNLLRIGGKS